MKIRNFIKRLNATELGLGATNDCFIAIPREVDLSTMFPNRQPLTILDLYSGNEFKPENSNIQYVQTGQNGQERISGLGKYFGSIEAKVGDEMIFKKVDNNGDVNYYMDFRQRGVIVFQKNNPYVEILTPALLDEYKVGDNYRINVIYNGEDKVLLVKFKEQRKKKTTSPEETKFYDLLIDEKSIIEDFKYQDFIEISLSDKYLNKMTTYFDSIVEWED